MVLWPNLHGAFPAGLLLVGIFVISRIIETTRSGSFGRKLTKHGPWAIALLACCLATLVNPYGWGIYSYVGGTSSVSAERGIDEWLPPSWDQAIGVAYFLSLAAMSAIFAIAWRRGRRVAIREAMLLICFGALAARSSRMIVWWLIVLAPLIADRLAMLQPRLRIKTYAPNLGAAVASAALAALCVLSLPPFHAYNPLLRLRSADTTTDDLEHARQSLGEGGNLFTRLEWGEYLTWAGEPNWRVFIDGRIEIVSDEVWREYSTITRGEPGWDDILRRYDVNDLILDRGYHRTTGLLPKVEADWIKTFDRGDVVVFQRKRPM
jgi:hypothetical protein